MGGGPSPGHHPHKKAGWAYYVKQTSKKSFLHGSSLCFCLTYCPYLSQWWAVMYKQNKPFPLEVTFGHRLYLSNRNKPWKRISSAFPSYSRKAMLFFKATMANSAKRTCITNQIFPNILRLMECTLCDLFFQESQCGNFFPKQFWQLLFFQ